MSFVHTPQLLRRMLFQDLFFFMSNWRKAFCIPGEKLDNCPTIFWKFGHDGKNRKKIH
jgi:hypothetical protein